MLKKFKNKPISILLISLLIFILFGQGIFSSIVLCIGEDDHIAIEFDHYSQRYISRNVNSHWPDSQSIFNMAPKKNIDSSCLDIPILMGSSHQNISSVQLLTTNINTNFKTLISRTSSFHLAAYAESVYDSVLPQRSSFITSTFTSLRTIILLI